MANDIRRSAPAASPWNEPPGGCCRLKVSQGSLTTVTRRMTRVLVFAEYKGVKVLEAAIALWLRGCSTRRGSQTQQETGVLSVLITSAGYT